MKMHWITKELKYIGEHYICSGRYSSYYMFIFLDPKTNNTLLWHTTASLAQNIKSGKTYLVKYVKSYKLGKVVGVNNVKIIEEKKICKSSKSAVATDCDSLSKAKALLGLYY